MDDDIDVTHLFDVTLIRFLTEKLLSMKEQAAGR